MNLLLDRGQEAELLLDGGWRTEVVVAWADAETAQLHAPVGHLQLPDRLSWAGATLIWTADDERIIRRDGILGGGDGAGLLRLTACGDKAFEQRRRHERFAAEIDAQIRTADATFSARTLDLSVEGMQLGDVPALDVPGEIGFTLYLSGAAVSGSGVVVRGAPDGARGVHFDLLDGVGAGTLEQWLGAQMDGH